MSDDEDDEMAEYSSSSDEADSDIDWEVTFSIVIDKDVDDMCDAKHDETAEHSSDETATDLDWEVTLVSEI